MVPEETRISQASRLNRYTDRTGDWYSAVLLLLTAAWAPADVTTEVRCREIAFSRAAESRDLDAFVSFLETDARFVGNSVLRGPEQIVAAGQSRSTAAPAGGPDGTGGAPEQP